MKHQHFDKLPFLVAGNLTDQETSEILEHLKSCQECQREVDFWQEIGTSIKSFDNSILAPQGLDIRLITQSQKRLSPRRLFTRAINLLKSQAYLIRKDLWPACALVMAIGIIAVILSDQSAILTFLAPLISAASLAAIYGPQNDPASELTFATTTSQWKILLARLTLVSGYNIFLALISSIFLLFMIPQTMLGELIFSWLGPVAMLSAMALMLSIWIGTGNAVAISFFLWTIQFFHTPQFLFRMQLFRRWDALLDGYRLFWQNPGWLFPIACIFLIAALYSTRLTEISNSAHSGNTW